MADPILAPLKPCIKCGATERDKRGVCKPCIKARAAAWYAANAEKRATWYVENFEKIKAKKAAHYGANSERIRLEAASQYAKNPGKKKALAIAWQKANPGQYKAAKVIWRAANPEARRIQNLNRRARKKEAGGRLSKGLSAKLFKLQKGKCPCCKQPLGNDYHMDHIVPIALGGPNTDENMQLLRAVCNMNKSSKEPVVFMQERGFLL